MSHEVANEWFYRLLGEEFGPVSRHVLDSLIAAGQIGDSDEVREAASSSWRTVGQLLATSKPNGSTRSTDGTTFSLESLSDAGFDTLTASSEQPAAQPEGWYYRSLGAEWGPFSFDDLLEHARQGDIAPDDDIRMGRQGKWRRAGSMGRLMAVMPFTVREAKTIPTGAKPADETNFDFDTRVPLRDSPPVREPEPVPAPPPPASVSPPPPPPPPPPSYAAPAPMMVPPPPVYGMPTYVAPPVPAWGYGQQAPVNDQGWYAWLDGVECGPMDYQQFANWAKTGRVSANDYVKQGKYSQWALAKTIPGLVPAAAPPPPAPAPAPAAAPAAKPSVQLPPPTKAAPVPAAVAAPTPAPVATPAPNPPTPPIERTALPSDSPPERKWNDQWGTSTVKSTYNPAAAAAAAAKKAAPAAKAKGKKRSGGGDLDIGALMKDVRVLGGLGVVALGALIYVGIMFMPEGTGKLVEAHKSLAKIHKEVEDKADSMPTDKKELDNYAKSIKSKTKKVTDTLLKSKHKAKSSLTGASSAINSAAGQKTADEVKKKLEDGKKKLDKAGKDLNLKG